MKITETTLTDKAIERRDYREVLEIEIDGVRKFSVYDGEPEDANLSRDFNDCWNIVGMMKLAHEAGLKGESFEIESKLVDEL